LDLLGDWLSNNFKLEPSSLPDRYQDLVRQCHKARKASLLSPLQLLSGQDQSRYHQFEQLFKLLCKIGKHVTVCRKLIDAVVLLPQDFSSDFLVQTVESSRLQAFPLLPKEATVENTATRMLQTPEEKAELMNRLGNIWDPGELLRLLQNEVKSKTRVHAELLLVDHFEKSGGYFLGGRDKYIGCSKPACYLCYAYIRHHPGRYALPSSHQKLYIGWRMPDVFSREHHSLERFSINEKILIKLIEEVRSDLNIEIGSHAPRIPYRPDSTIGITSSDEVSIFDGVDELLSNFDRLDISTTKLDEYETDSTDSDDEGGVRLI
jgi:hypothetical protein